MTGSYLLDTNVVIAVFKGDPLVHRRLLRASKAFLSIVTLGELFYGAQSSMRIQENVGRIEELAASTSVLDCNTETARHYGLIKAQLRKQGTPIPENDLWIAALANQHGLILVTRDGHFSDVSDLRRETW
ncbi:MAG: type II toxin-antitoxin system VapC family toxin [Thermoanaerobaculia bacterium]